MIVCMRQSHGCHSIADPFCMHMQRVWCPHGFHPWEWVCVQFMEFMQDTSSVHMPHVRHVAFTPDSCSNTIGPSNTITILQIYTIAWHVTWPSIVPDPDRHNWPFSPCTHTRFAGNSSYLQSPWKWSPLQPPGLLPQHEGDLFHSIYAAFIQWFGQTSQRHQCWIWYLVRICSIFMMYTSFNIWQQVTFISLGWSAWPEHIYPLLSDLISSNQQTWEIITRCSIIITCFNHCISHIIWNIEF